MWNAGPEELIGSLEQRGIRRGFIVETEAGVYRASHPLLDPLAEAMAVHPDCQGHQGAFFELGLESGHLLSAFVHKTTRGQAAGGVRFWRYGSVAELFADGLRLSRGMGQKCALAGLWWGGGKGVIARRVGCDYKDPVLRKAVYRDYGRFMSGLAGLYVTAEDVGTQPADMAEIFTTTRHTTCIPPVFGGSGNPSELTAAGVVVGIEAALHSAGMGTLQGKQIAMQGLGNVARFMLKMLCERGVARVVACDVDPEALAQVKAEPPAAPLELRLVELGDFRIFSERADVLIPNATGAVLNPETIGMIQAKVVAGAANNQLAVARRDGRALKERGVVYVPDFLCNRMGIVNCANEQYGWIPDDPAIAIHLQREAPEGIFQRTLEVLRRAAATERGPAEEAELLADELMRKPHPLWPKRGAQLIHRLVEGGWAE